MTERRQTIFRRARSEGGTFTIVRNEIIDDERLSLAALGAMAKLLRKPGDWTVLPHALRKEFGIGRDKFYGVLRELRQARYLHYATQHGDNGEFITGVYSVYDAPVAPASEIDTRDGDDAETMPRAAFPDTDEPYTGNPDVELKTEQNKSPPYPPALVERPPVAGSTGQESKADAPSRRAVLSPHSPAAAATQPPPSFDEFWAKWRSGPTESRPAALRRWTRLSEASQAAAFERIDAYSVACRKAGQRRAHAKTYLRDRLFENVGGNAAGTFEIRPRSRAVAEWAMHYGETGQSFKAKEMARRFEAGQPWFERTEFPPHKGEG